MVKLPSGDIVMVPLSGSIEIQSISFDNDKLDSDRPISKLEAADRQFDKPNRPSLFPLFNAVRGIAFNLLNYRYLLALNSN